MPTATVAVLAPPPRAAEPPPRPDGPIHLAVAIEGSLEATLVQATDPELGPRLSQVTKRALVWWLDVRRDLRKGDRLELLYEERPGEEPVVHALWFDAQRLGGPRVAIHHRPKSAAFPRWYTPDGAELELRLKHAPLDGYEQVTSLINDGRGHKGVDFKAPVGLPVKAPFGGTVVRRNWSTRANGLCVELEEGRTGTRAMFLHLSGVEARLRPGQRVERGEVLGRSGNTGRSTAPHLHYQLERGGRVLDPFAVHETWRARLSAEETEELKRELARHEARRRQD